MLFIIADWLFDATLLEWALRLVVGSAIGQTLFVLLWSTLPWWRSIVGRALMVKSLALAIYLDWAVTSYYWGPFDNSETIAVCLFGLVFAGIWSQLGAISYEMLRARLDRRR